MATAPISSLLPPAASSSRDMMMPRGVLMGWENSEEPMGANIGTDESLPGEEAARVTPAPSPPLPNSLVPKCALTKQDLKEPVLASDGHTYEKQALVGLLESTRDPRSPVTGEILNADVVIPNHAVTKLLTQLRPQTPTAAGPVRVNCKINSALEELDKLHAVLPWIPGSHQIRPTPETIARKHQFFDTVLPQYETECDFVLHTIFGMDAKRDPSSGKLKVAHFAVLVMKPHTLRKTLPNIFPYQVPPGTLHFVHWAYPHFSPKPDIDERETNEAITRDLRNYFGPEVKFEFVWDVNPKMSLPHELTGCMHAHVFVHLC